jgi:adenine phosphoribosyltransferase
MNTHYPVEIAGIKRQLRLMEVAPGVRIAILNILGDTELVQAAGKALAAQLPKDAEMIVTAEAKSIPLAHAISVESGLPYVVLRKRCFWMRKTARRSRAKRRLCWTM